MNPAQPWTDFFAFGFWRHAGHPYQGGLEGQFRCMRRMGMNTLLAFPDITDDGAVAEQTAKVRAALATAKRFGMRIMPYCQTSVARLAAVAGAFREETAILGWYIRDEPNPDFLPTFLEYRAAIAAAGAVQPVVCLFYRGDSTRDFAPHQPLLLSDVYPLGYVHQTTSLGPHFGHRQGHEHFLNYDMGKLLPFGNHGVRDWLALCRTYCRPMPHWLTLGAFEGANGKAVRWREPTVNEMKLQVYQAVAGGVTGITYYLYSLVIDNYGVPFAHHHGEGTPMATALAEIGAELTPFGPLLSHAAVEQDAATLATWRPTPPADRGIEVRRLRSTSDGAHYLVVTNNDVLVQQTALVHLDDEFLRGRGVYDLQALQPAPTDAFAVNGAAFPVQLRPGHGRIYSVCSPEEFAAQRQTLLHGRCQHEVAGLMLEWDLAAASGLELSRAAVLRAEYEQCLAEGDYAAGLAAVRRCAALLQATMAGHAEFAGFRQDLEGARQVLSRMAAPRPLFHPNHAVAHQGLSELFAALEARFWGGRYASCRPVMRDLAALLQRLDAERREWSDIDGRMPPVDEAAVERLRLGLAG